MKNFVVPIIYYIFANVSHADGCLKADWTQEKAINDQENIYKEN